MAGTMSRLTYEVELGGRINECIRAVFDENPTMITEVLAHIGRENCTAIDETIIAKIKPKLKQLLTAACPTFQPTAATEKTVMDAELLDLWRAAAKDPDTEPPKWLARGAPAGILEPVQDRGIFPLYDPALDIAEVEAGDL